MGLEEKIMRKQFQECTTTKLLFISLLIDLSIGVLVSVNQGKLLWGISLVGALITAIIAFINVTRKEED